MSRIVRRSGGFTIVELMIATTVFSLVLVVLTVGVMEFTRSYYKGVTASSTQNAARTTIEDVTQGVQFSGLQVRPLDPKGPDGTSDPRLESHGFCVGSTRYSFLPGWQLKDTKNENAFQNTHVFVRDTPAGGCYDNQERTAQDLIGSYQGGTELLGINMRVSKAQLVAVGGDPNLYRMTLRIVYGDADLLLSPSQNPGEQNNAANFNVNATRDDVTCRNATAGNQFCAVSQLSTVIQRRVD